MTRAVRIHQLKIAPKYFNAVVAGQRRLNFVKTIVAIKLVMFFLFANGSMAYLRVGNGPLLSLMCFRLMTSWQFQNNG